MKKDFIDNTLIKLKREYTKDEVVSALYKKLSERDVIIGGLESEIEHLMFESSKKEKAIKEKLRIVEANKIKEGNETICNLRNEVNRKNSKIKDLKKDIVKLVNGKDMDLDLFIKKLKSNG